MRLSPDYRFVITMLYSFKMEASSFDDAINYIDKLQKSIDKNTDDIDLIKDGLDKLRLWSEDHKRNMLVRIDELSKIKSSVLIEEVQRPSISGSYDTLDSFIE